MTHNEHILECVLRICVLDKIYDCLELIDLNGLLMCNKTISEIITNKLLSCVYFNLTKLYSWNINRLAKVKRIVIDINSELLFFRQLFPKLELISFDNKFTHSIIETTLPSTLKEIYFKYDCEFNLEIPPNALPSSLTKLTFGDYFNQQIGKDVLPPNLTKLTFGDYFNQQIEKDVLPPNLTELVFGDYFDQPIENSVLPINLKKLTFGYYFNQLIKKGVLPNSLTELVFDTQFNQQIVRGALPPGLVSLEFGTCFNQLINKDVLPNSLTELIFGSEFNHSILTGVLSNGLKSLIFGICFNQPITKNIFPNTLEKLGIWEKNDESHQDFFNNMERKIIIDDLYFNDRYYIEYTKRIND